MGGLEKVCLVVSALVLLGAVSLTLVSGYPYYYSGYYSDLCVVWVGYEWVNVCPYYPYYY
jgi:hypothetical protein